jgi:hypothetical protein
MFLGVAAATLVSGSISEHRTIGKMDADTSSA